MRPWILAIDFGTSYTVAAGKIGDRAPEVIEIAGERRIPSVVMIDAEGNTVVGRIADDLASTHPKGTLRAIKNRLGDQAPVVLDGKPRQVIQLVAALLRHVYDDAVRQMGGPPTEVRLTHPATWMRPWLSRLTEAAAKAGIDDPMLVPEPVAAALSFATEFGVEPGGHVAVYDLGGGTFDSAVVTAVDEGFAIVGRPNGDQTIGGELFDELIVNHLGEQLDEDTWEQLQAADDPAWQQVRASLRNEARRAKETLSGNAYAALIVPLPTGMRQLRLTRDEFETLVRPYVEETIDILRRCVEQAGVAPDELAGVALVGGSSRSPIVERMVTEAFPNVPVVRRGDPKTAVATGATRAHRAVTKTPPRPDQRTTREHLSADGGSPKLPAGTPAGPASGPTSLPEGTPAGPSSGPTSLPEGTPAGPTSHPETRVQPLVSSSKSSSTSSATSTSTSSSTARPKQKRSSGSTTRLAVAIAVVGLLIGGLLVFLGLRRGGEDDTGPDPITTEIAQGLLTPTDQVVNALGNGWFQSESPDEQLDFCNHLDADEPSVDIEQKFETDDTAAPHFYWQAVAGYPSLDDAAEAYELDQRWFAECEIPDDYFGPNRTIALTDVSSQFASLGEGVIAGRLLVTDSVNGDPIHALYQIEMRRGDTIALTSYQVNDEPFDQATLQTYANITNRLFQRVSAER